MSKVIQLSDPHIVPRGQLAYGVVDTGAALATAVATVNRCLPVIGPVDLAIVTGDLTDFGSSAEYARFRAIMSELKIPYRVIPGNHDLRTNLRASFADQEWMPLTGGISWSVELPDFGLVCLDSLVDGHHHGHLEADALDLLNDALKGLAGKPVLVGVHHPPFMTGIRPMDDNNLRNGAALQVMLDAYPGESRLVCGHVHRSVTRAFGTSIGLIAPGTSHAVTLDQREGNPHTLSLEPGGFMLHEWRDGFVSHVVAANFSPNRFPFTTPQAPS
ncbi:phosphodiesterase [Mesorhizobium sp. 8]|uniref:phosphodiesterase n=1 Tax=Mesorhizobium sp. 8 TaxID=2584466 RepID=UPI00111EF215|nr:phosphodiesterase [Mesorhizobium sp. 8]QDC02347.1 phosphodiesterase [Mesorhizobium sp. 8]